jgi:uncharacterized protein with HEPN domain
VPKAVNEKDLTYLRDMLRAAEKACLHIRHKNRRSFYGDSLLQDAVARNLEVLGEAARNVSELFQRDHPEIPWRRIIEQGSRLIQQYRDVENEELWEITTVQLPQLIQTLSPLVPPPPPGAKP